MVPYNETADLFRTDSVLHRHISQAISLNRILEQLVYELWFPRNTATIWVVCPQCHQPGEFAERSSPDYTYLDNLGDTDALLEIMVFLSRYYPKTIIEKFSSDDLPTGHTKNNIVVVGGPGSCEDISNRVCLEMMTAINSRVSYTEDCEKMAVSLMGNDPLELQAALRSDISDQTSPDYFNMRRDYGYFARFPNPLNEAAIVILASGIHTAGVLGAARAFADSPEALRNYHSVFSSDVTPKSFECHFEVSVLNGNVRVPDISREHIYSLGLGETPLTDTAREIGESQIDSEKHNPTTVLFIAGDRGGAQRNQAQIPREFEAIQRALRGSEYRDAICVTIPILAASHQKLVEAYRHRPEILHFAGHGDNRSLSLISDQGLLVNQSPIIAEQLSAILLNFPEHIRLCVLNTCDSADVAKHLVDTHATDAAVGWPGKLSDADAIEFSGTFYGRLGDGLTLAKSFALAANSLTTQETPVLYPAKGVDTDLIFISTRVKK